MELFGIQICSIVGYRRVWERIRVIILTRNLLTKSVLIPSVLSVFDKRYTKP